MRLQRVSFSVLMIGLLLLTSSVFAQSTEPVTLRVITHDSFNVSEEVLAAFEAESGITVELLPIGDTGTLVNQAVLTQSNPLGDVLYGIDNTFLTRGLKGDIFLPYESPLLEAIPDAFKLDDQFRVSPVNYGDVCLNYDTAYFEAEELALPESLLDLTQPEYKGLLVVENPATSSPGLAFLLATIAVFGDGADDSTEGDDEASYTYLDYWADLAANDVLIVDSWTNAYYGEFTVPSEDGTRPLVVSYASSPPAEVIYADPRPETAPTGSIVADNTCFRQIEFVGILQGTQNEAAAQAFVDFMLDEAFQNDVALQMFVFPVNENAELPEDFIEHADYPEVPVEIDFELIEENREAWILAWTEAVLR